MSPPAQDERPAADGYSGWAVLLSAVVGVGVALLSVWWASGFGVFYEGLFRVGPTVPGDGVGADWAAGNSVAWLKTLIKLVHAADAVLGVFILFMVFLHWASFRRLAARMRQPGESTTGSVAADGGRPDGGRAGDGHTDDGRRDAGGSR